MIFAIFRFFGLKKRVFFAQLSLVEAYIKNRAPSGETTFYSAHFKTIAPSDRCLVAEKKFDQTERHVFTSPIAVIRRDNHHLHNEFKLYL